MSVQNQRYHSHSISPCIEPVDIRASKLESTCVHTGTLEAPLPRHRFFESGLQIAFLTSSLPSTRIQHSQAERTSDLTDQKWTTTRNPQNATLPAWHQMLNQ